MAQENVFSASWLVVVSFVGWNIEIWESRVPRFTVENKGSPLMIVEAGSVSVTEDRRSLCGHDMFLSSSVDEK